MEIVVHEPLGVTVTGVSIREIDADSADRMTELLAEHGVVVIPDQDVDDAAFVRFLTRFGALTFTQGETPVPGTPDLTRIREKA